MLDPVDPGSDRLLDTRQRVSVREDPQSRPMSGLYGARELRVGELGCVDVCPGRHHAPPVAITLMTSTPRAECSATARRMPSRPVAAPPK